MNDQMKEDALYSARILTDCYKANVGDNSWIQANPEIAIAVEKAVLAMEEAIEAIIQKHSDNDKAAHPEERQTG